MQPPGVTSPLQLAPQALLSTVGSLLVNAGGYGLRAGEVARLLCSTTQQNVPSMLLLEQQPATQRSFIHEQASDALCWRQPRVCAPTAKAKGSRPTA